MKEKLLDEMYEKLINDKDIQVIDKVELIYLKTLEDFPYLDVISKIVYKKDRVKQEIGDTSWIQEKFKQIILLMKLGAIT